MPSTFSTRSGPLKIMELMAVLVQASICCTTSSNVVSNTSRNADSVDYALMVSYALFALKYGPHLKNIQGIGSINKDRNPRREVAQAIPSRLYTIKLHEKVSKERGAMGLTLHSEERENST
jgi:hypothetical protein